MVTHAGSGEYREDPATQMVIYIFYTLIQNSYRKFNKRVDDIIRANFGEDSIELDLMQGV